MFFLPFLAVAAVSTIATAVTASSNRAAAQDQQDRAIEEQRRVDALNIAENRRAEEENERIAQSNREMARDYAETDFAGRLVRESETAGFNPLTVMRAGGLSAYTNAYGNAMHASVQQPTSSPYYRNPVPQNFIPGMGSVLGEAFSAGASVMGQAVGQHASNANSQLLLTRQLDHASSMQSVRTGVTRGGSGALSSVALSNIPNNWDQGDVTVTNPHRFASIDVNYADAESMEARYGEPGDWVFGVRNIVADGLYNLTGWSRDDRVSLRNRATQAISNFVGGLSRYSPGPSVQSSPHLGPLQAGQGAW